MTEGAPLYLIGPLPPARGAEAALTAYIAESLADEYRIFCVQDSFAPPRPQPATGIAVITIRDLGKSPHREGVAGGKRLYIVGNSGDSCYVLDLMRRLPAPALLADMTLHDVRRAWYRSGQAQATATQTDGGLDDISWLTGQFSADENAAPILQALEQQRISNAFFEELSGTGFIHRLATKVFFPSERAAAFARTDPQASGIPDSHTNTGVTVTLPPLRTEPRQSGRSSPAVLCILGREGPGEAVMAYLEDALAVLPLIATIQAMGPGDAGLAGAIAEADLVVDLDDALTRSVSVPALRAKAHKCPVLVPGTGWSTEIHGRGIVRMPPFAGAETAATIILALLGDPDARTDTEQFEIRPTHTPAPLLADCYAVSPCPPCPPLPPLRETPTPLKNAPHRHGGKTPPRGRIAMLGAVPGNAVLRQIMPDMNPMASTRFAAPETAEAIEAMSGLPHPLLLPRLGFEATHFDPGTRQAMPEGLRPVDAVCNFSDIPADFAQDPLHTDIQWSFRIRNEETDRLYDSDWSIDRDQGLLWRPRTSMDGITLILLAGRSRWTTVSIETDTGPFLIADSFNSQHLDRNKPARVAIERGGLLCLDIGLLAHDGLFLLPLEDLQERLRQTRFILCDSKKA